ncbi:MAG: tol-pal system YbgF family protein, partial [Kofleriaceae bacterium]
MKLFVITMMLMLAGVATSHADSALDAKAKVHGERGQRLYRNGKYAEARAEFSAAFDLSGRAGFVFNMAECSRLAGDDTVARDHYEKYVQLEPRGKLADLARQRLSDLPAPIEPLPPIAPPVTGVPSPAAAAANAAGAQPAITGVADLGHKTEDRSMWTRWPIWAVIGAGVIATSAVIIVATRGPDCGAN